MGTTADKLQKVLQTKTGLKEAINNKGGTITDETPFEEYITQVENLSGGEPEITYVPVPNEGYVDKIYFNTSLTTEEVDKIITNANLEWVDNGYGIQMYLVFLPNRDIQQCLQIMNVSSMVGKTAYVIILLPISSEADTVYLYSSTDLSSEGIPFVGFYPDLINNGSFMSVGFEALSSLEGIPIGLQNDALKELFYVDKLVDGNGYAEVVSTAEEMEANLTAENKHKFYLYNGEDGQYTNGEYYAVVDDTETVVEESLIKKLIDAKGHCDYLFYAVGAIQGTGVTWGETQDISKLISYNDTENIKYFRNMFTYANITSVPNINMEQAYNISQMFYNAKIENFDITKINLSNVSICDSLFHSIQLLNNKEEILTITIPKNITSWKSLFYNSKIKNLLKIIINTYNLGCTSTFQTSGDTTYMKEVEINLYKDKDDTSSYPTSFESTFYNNKSIEKVTLNFENINRPTSKYNTYIDTSFKNTFQLASALKEVIMKKGSFPIKISSFNTDILKACTNITNLKLIGIATNIQLSDNSSFGTLLTLDSLINTCKECINVGSARKLTIGSNHITTLSNVYVRLTNEVEEDETLPKLPMEVCESTDEGAMTISEYMALKNWSIA